MALTCVLSGVMLIDSFNYDSMKLKPIGLKKALMIIFKIT